MKIDGSQYSTAKIIAKYIRHYMRYYGVTNYVEPFCGLGFVYAELFSNQILLEPECSYYLSDFNPFIVGILNRLWNGGDIPDVLDKEERRRIGRELRNRYREDEDILAPFEGLEDWEVGCNLILGTLHQNVIKGYIGDKYYSRNVSQAKNRILKVPPPTELKCCDYMDKHMMPHEKRHEQKLIYCDFPEPTANNFFPFGMYFDRDEFFEYADKWDDDENIVIFSSKYFPENDKYELIFNSGDQNLYIGKRWYMEDILDVGKGAQKKWSGPVRTVSQGTARRGGVAFPPKGRKRRSLRLEKKAQQT